MSSNDPLVVLAKFGAAVRGRVETILKRCGYRTSALPSDARILRRISEDQPAAVLLAVGPCAADALELLAALKHAHPSLPVILVSRDEQTSTVVQAMRLGASDFLCEPLLEQSLVRPLAHALREQRLTAELAPLRNQVEAEPRYLLAGHSPRMLEVHHLIARVAATDATVLIRGESGTGKELVAREVHARSARAAKPFVKVNCAALPGELLESELFGYERGAFTGAVQQKPGRFEFANQGTMFLDEIGDMSHPLQGKLLQVLQDGEFSRLGGRADVRVDVRIVAATSRDLERAVADGAYREDLFFRLNVVSIALPPLRERREDVPVLLEHFFRKYSVHYNKPQPSIPPDTIQLLHDYDWPGNIRELENAVRRMVVLGTDAPVARELQRAISIRPTDSPPDGHRPAAADVAAAADPATPPPHGGADGPSGDGPSAAGSLKDIARAAARAAERVAISRMLQRTRWNRKAAAEILGISYKALLYKIKENGLDKSPSTS